MLKVIQEEINLFSEWEHLSEFEGMISDSSDIDHCLRNFRKTIYIYLCHILQFGKPKWIEEEWSSNSSLFGLTTSHYASPTL